MKTIAIIQARMQSERLPGKSLMLIHGQPMLWHVLHRVSQATTLDGILVATGDSPANDPIAEFCRVGGWDCYRGSEDDVLDRYFRAAYSVKANVIVRITGDCPLHSGEIIDLCVNTLKRDDQHYVTNTLPPETWPDGTDVEAFTMRALSSTWWRATLSSDREHVTPWLRRNLPGQYIGALVFQSDLSRWRLTVDTSEDLELVGQIMARLGVDCDWRDAVKLLEVDHDLARLNVWQERNEGYRRSLEKERITK